MGGIQNCYRFANPAEALGGIEASRRGGLHFLDKELMHGDNCKDNFWYQHLFINPKGMQACTWMDPSPKVRPKDPLVDPDGAIGGARKQPFWGTKNACGCSGKQNEPKWHFQHFLNVMSSMLYMIAMQWLLRKKNMKKREENV